MGKKVIIIGNGPSLLKAENGLLINKFDHIVRFNAYSINKYEKFVGTRTDCWINTINYQYKDKEQRLKVKYKRFIWHSWQWNPLLDKGYISFKEHYDKESFPVRKTTRDTILELQEYAEDSNYFSYSTGLIAIWIYLKEYPSVTITGFDWWESTNHHYNDTAPRGTNHNPKKEYLVIQKLIKDKKVKFLA